VLNISQTLVVVYREQREVRDGVVVLLKNQLEDLRIKQRRVHSVIDAGWNNLGVVWTKD